MPNIEPTSLYVATAFSWVNFLFHVEQSCIHKFIAEIDYFTKEQFQLLNNRIMNKRNKEILMNEKHLIILYATLYMMSILYQSKEEFGFLISELNDDQAEADILTIKEPYLQFAADSLYNLKKNYKNNHGFAVAMAKINSFKIVESI